MSQHRTRLLLSLAFVCLVSCQRPVAVDPGDELASNLPGVIDRQRKADADALVVRANSTAEKIIVARPTEGAPVQAAAAVAPSPSVQGASATLIVRVKIAPGWHIYAFGGNGGPNQPTRIELTLPEGCTAEGKWQSPVTSALMGAQGLAEIYETEAIFKQPLQCASSMPTGRASIVCTIHFQACDHRHCLRPERLTLDVPIQIVSEEK
jgi:DsbC/DsbD-like thiol-disulfide interchange protein